MLVVTAVPRSFQAMTCKVISRAGARMGLKEKPPLVVVASLYVQFLEAGVLSGILCPCYLF